MDGPGCKTRTHVKKINKSGHGAKWVNISERGQRNVGDEVENVLGAFLLALSGVHTCICK